MQRILRFLLPLAVLLAAMTGLVACGGDDEASTDTDVNTLLDRTFTGEKEVDSGQFALNLQLNVSGGGSGLEGPVEVSLSGPFESQGATELPKFAIDLEASGAGQSIQAGVTSTGEKGFVSFSGQDYVVSDEVFQQFKQGFEQAAAEGEGEESATSLSNLGINPKEWLTDPQNAGEGQVGDTDVIRITGGVDVARMLEDLNSVLSRAGSLGLQGQELPTELTEEQRQQVQEAVEDVQVEIATGKEDYILRQIKIDLSAADPSGGGGTADITFDLQLTELNEGQDFPEPENPQPFEELLSQFGGGAGLGGLLGGGALGGAGGSGGGSAGGSQESIQEYSQCLEEAGQDLEAAQACADLLSP